jgi:hypothetical protein
VTESEHLQTEFILTLLINTWKEWAHRFQPLKPLKLIQLKSPTNNLQKSVQDSQKFVANVDKNATKIIN